MNGHVEAITALSRLRVDINAKDMEGKTALHQARSVVLVVPLFFTGLW